MENKVTLSQKAFEILKNMIITYELKPGERINEKKLLSMLSLSRTPMREAILRLHEEGLIDYFNHSGIYVKELSFKSVKDYFEVIVPLEMAISEIAPLRIKQEELEGLEDINKKIIKAIATGNYLEITLQNSLFHRYIAQTTNNMYFFSFIDKLQNLSQRLAFLCFSKEISKNKTLDEHFQSVTRQHNAIIKNLREGDTESLKKNAAEHIQLFQSRITRYLTQIIK
jgi:GntR family transcriptional regulator, rspAB operon transcriptional repressor